MVDLTVGVPFVWHDLVKDPNDLPKDNEKVAVAIYCESTGTFCIDDGYNSEHQFTYKSEARAFMEEGPEYDEYGEYSGNYHIYIRADGTDPVPCDDELDGDAIIVGWTQAVVSRKDI